MLISSARPLEKEILQRKEKDACARRAPQCPHRRDSAVTKQDVSLVGERGQECSLDRLQPRVRNENQLAHITAASRRHLFLEATIRSTKTQAHYRHKGRILKSCTQN